MTSWDWMCTRALEGFLWVSQSMRSPGSDRVGGWLPWGARKNSRRLGNAGGQLERSQTNLWAEGTSGLRRLLLLCLVLLCLQVLVSHKHPLLVLSLFTLTHTLLCCPQPYMWTLMQVCISWHFSTFPTAHLPSEHGRREQCHVMTFSYQMWIKLWNRCRFLKHYTFFWSLLPLDSYSVCTTTTANIYYIITEGSPVLYPVLSHY